MKKLIKQNIVVLIWLVVFTGCHPQHHDEATTIQTERVDLSSKEYSPDVVKFVAKVQGLIDRYKKEAKADELNDHGVKGQLADEVAASLAGNANSILDELNRHFDKPVCKRIGDVWYQVPSRFVISKAASMNDKNAMFTISHHDCGIHEFDFIVDEESGKVVAERYDSLNIDW